MNREGRRHAALLSVPLAWLLAVFALAGPVALSSHASPTSTKVLPVSVMENPDDDSHGSPGVLALPPKVHLIVNRTGTGTAPPAPVLVVLPAPVDRTDAGIRIATERAGTPPAAAWARNFLWGRAPPRASA